MTDEIAIDPASDGASSVAAPIAQAGTDSQPATEPLPPVPAEPTTAQAETVLEHDAEREVHPAVRALWADFKGDWEAIKAFVEAELKRI